MKFGASFVVVALALPAVAHAQVVLAEDFESGAAGWTFVEWALVPDGECGAVTGMASTSTAESLCFVGDDPYVLTSPAFAGRGGTAYALAFEAVLESFFGDDGFVVLVNTATGAAATVATVDDNLGILLHHSAAFTVPAAWDGDPLALEFRYDAVLPTASRGFLVDDVVLAFACAPPANYCIAAPNSLGPGAVMDSRGTTHVSANDFELMVLGAAASQPGLFFYGPAQTQTPFGEGFLCVDPGAVGVFRLNPPAFTTASGVSSRAVDITAPPEPAGQVTAGSTWHFQFWFRDILGGGQAFNLSDGLSATFCP